MVFTPTKKEQQDAKDLTRKNGAGIPTAVVDSQITAKGIIDPNLGKSIESKIETTAETTINTNLSLEEKMDLLLLCLNKLLLHMEELTGDTF